MNSASARPTPERPSGIWRQLRQGLQRTRNGITGGLSDLLLGRKELPPELLVEIESRLLQADAGPAVTDIVIADLTAALQRRQLADWGAVQDCLQASLTRILAPVAVPLRPAADGPRPLVLLLIGVNGAGKTTTIAKIASHFRNQGLEVVLAAADTFRAAAIEQLQAWGTRIDVPVISQQAGADAAAVIYDALGSARARNADVLIADTAGRLHNKNNLMDELKKIRRTIAKFDDRLPVETLLVIDGGTGGNAVSQCREFNDAVGVSGLVITKLDGTARGGVLLALARQFSIPVRFLGVGEGIRDLQDFDAAAYAAALVDARP